MSETGKRIVICADGTWNDPEDEVPTNVLRVARAIEPVASDGMAQVVFYDWGVGTYYEKTRGGIAGVGMEKNIQDCYRFIVQNYDPGDKLYLFGFSRGAFTTRALAGLLNNCGILRRVHAREIPQAFELYKKRSVRPGSAAARQWRNRHCHGSGQTAVEYIGVWDTVGALGIPTRALGFVEERDLFFDTEPGSNIRVARHAVAIDEQRADFTPTLWSAKDGVDVKQVWFAGVHSDVGGGYEPTAGGSVLSDIPLAWLAREAAGLEFERQLVVKSKLDPLAPQHRSRRRFWKVLGKKVREIPFDATVHESVVKRYEAGSYDSRPLQAWLQLHQGAWGGVER